VSSGGARVRERRCLACRGVAATLHDAALDQGRQPVAEHAARHIEVRMEIVEASQAPERRSQDQERPAVADQLEASREIAVAQRYWRAAPERGVGLVVSHERCSLSCKDGLRYA